MDSDDYLIVSLLKGFEWFDEGLQAYNRRKGWRQLTRPESMVMTHVILGIVRPADIARSLGLSRQTVHVTVRKLIGMGIFKFEDDPTDGRIKIVGLTETGQAMRRDAQASVRKMTEILASRIGAQAVRELHHALRLDWGPPCGWEEDAATAEAADSQAADAKPAFGLRSSRLLVSDRAQTARSRPRQ